MPVLRQLLPGQGGVTEPQETFPRPAQRAQGHQVQVLLKGVLRSSHLLQARKSGSSGKALLC